jgi:hypothetical protein
MLEPGISSSIQKWLRISFFNLLLVAVLGVIMRYKIAYSLPFIDQSNFLYAHSHFAFTGWVSQVLMTLMWAFLYQYLPVSSLKKYPRVLMANLVVSYGMLVSFCLQGYGLVSIVLSTLSIFVSYAFAIFFWRDLKKITPGVISVYWFKAALLFSVLSSLGPFSLTYMMSANIQHPTWFLVSTYYFLHFQYNGWFFFACMGLLLSRFEVPAAERAVHRIIFWLFACAFVPAYFLSALWLPMPLWVYVLVVSAAAAELAGWLVLLKVLLRGGAVSIKMQAGFTKVLFILPAIALSIKLLLQLGSTIPSLSKLAFGFRPVVIGYLHLMFLGVITLFIIAFCKWNGFMLTRRGGNTGVVIFAAGIIINEILLMIQGLSYMNYIRVPYISELLLAAAVCMLTGILLMYLNYRASDHAVNSSETFSNSI